MTTCLAPLVDSSDFPPNDTTATATNFWSARVVSVVDLLDSRQFDIRIHGC